MALRLTTSVEAPPDLDTKLVILLGTLGTNNGKARVDLTGNSSVILLERTNYVYITV